MPSNTICVCGILNDSVTSEAKALSNLAQIKAIKSLELDGISSKVLLSSEKQHRTTVRLQWVKTTRLQ